MDATWTRVSFALSEGDGPGFERKIEPGGTRFRDPGHSTSHVAIADTDGDVVERMERNASKGDGDRDQKKTRVCVVGCGAAGMACAWSLGRFPEQFDVEVWETHATPGGVATTETVRLPGGESVQVDINDGVQGGAPSYRNLINIMQEVELEPYWLDMKVSFGVGELRWNNYEETPIIVELRDEIKKFGKLLKKIKRFEPIFAFVPISKLMKWFRFSDSFSQNIVFPLTALFFGTGNQTPNVSSAIFARVFNDDNLRLYNYDPELFLASAPRMFAFPRLSDMYTRMQKQTEARSGGQVKFYYNRPVQAVTRGKKGVSVRDQEGVEVEFEEVVFACNSETAEALLKAGSGTRWWERRVFGGITYYDDVSVTHTDLEYMQKHYEVDVFRDEMYFVRTYPSNRGKIEMSFDLSHYQPHAKTTGGQGIYQTIFLNRAEDEHLWTRNKLDQDKVMLVKWWRQFSHSVRHFVRSVPFWRFVQGKLHSWYAGSYTLANTHEIAMISGLAVAHRLGAPYPFADDKLARLQFEVYLGLIHGRRYEPDSKETEHPA